MHVCYLSLPKKGPKHTCSCAREFVFGNVCFGCSHDKTKNTRVHLTAGMAPQTCESGGKVANAGPKHEKCRMLSCARVF